MVNDKTKQYIAQCLLYTEAEGKLTLSQRRVECNQKKQYKQLAYKH